MKRTTALPPFAGDPTRDLTPLEQRLGHAFADRSLLERALTHVSTTNSRADSFQRLEFLGDRVLGLAVADLLLRTYPLADEGELSRRLAAVVRRETCADVAGEWDAARYVKMGRSEAQSGGATRAALLSDICESIIGAVHLDAGFGAAAALVFRSFGDRIAASDRPLRDSKTALQEWAQAHGLGTPSYEALDRAGPDHAPDFTIAVQVGDRQPAQGRGGSKRVAEQAAAQAFLAREGVSMDGTS